MVGTPAMAGTGSVLMIYGLAQGKFNCDHIFNLLCSYGNVLKVCVCCVSTVINADYYCCNRSYIHHVLTCVVLQ